MKKSYGVEVQDPAEYYNKFKMFVTMYNQIKFYD